MSTSLIEFETDPWANKQVPSISLFLDPKSDVTSIYLKSPHVVWHERDEWQDTTSTDFKLGRLQAAQGWSGHIEKAHTQGQGPDGNPCSPPTGNKTLKEWPLAAMVTNVQVGYPHCVAERRDELPV